MLKTNEFAQLCDTTKRTIIYYDQIGLLKPVSYKAKYRLYDPKQVLVFQKIVLLKSFGLTLSDLKIYIRKESGLKDIFTQRKKDLEKQKAVLEKRITKLNEFLKNLREGKPLIAPQIRKIKPYVIYGIKKTGRYIDINNHQKEIFKLIGDPHYQKKGLTIFHTPGYKPEESKMTTGVMIDNPHPPEIKRVNIIQVPAYNAVTYTHIGSYSYLSYVWQFLDRFINEQKLTRHKSLDPREFYNLGSLREKNEENYITELHIPIKG